VRLKDVTVRCWRKKIYLCQVYGVSGGDTVFVPYASVCACLCSRPVSAYSSKTVKATDFKLDVLVSRNSPDMTV